MTHWREMASLLVSYSMTYTTKRIKEFCFLHNGVTGTQPARPLKTTRGLDKVFLSTCLLPNQTWVHWPLSSNANLLTLVVMKESVAMYFKSANERRRDGLHSKAPNCPRCFSKGFLKAKCRVGC